MTQRMTRLIDVLAPPANRWLQELAAQKACLPAGVRVIRFGTDDDEESVLSDGVAGRSGVTMKAPTGGPFAVGQLAST